MGTTEYTEYAKGRERRPSYSSRLRQYFSSGWAFFIPYLAAYLLYAWTKWPVNPGAVAGGSMEQGAGVWVPCLLHVYWVLHGIHAILAGIAMRAWGKRLKEEQALGSREQGASHQSPVTGYQSPPTASPSTVHRSPSTGHRLLDTGYRLLPWLCLALVFYIPGIYLEWPSDPWEHLRRINEWHILDQVTAHSAWKKSSYFLPYSLTGHTSGLSQLTWLNYYYTGICLLLSWQYYRLARAVGLGERASFVFVLLNALTFGNNIFSFYRYYGLSSSIFAQLGAVALTRVALETLRPPLTSYQLPVTGHCPPSTAYPLLAARYSLLRSTALPLIPCSLLLVFTLFNHIQGLGIAGLGVFAVVVWRLIEWKRAVIFWLFGTAVILSIATVLWFPRHPTVDEVYRPQGWLTAWYGFSLFSPSSPAFARALQILGTFGVINAIAGTTLISRNQAVGWITIGPLLILCLPCVAIPFANSIAASHPREIVTFARLLLSIPSGLAVTLLAQQLIPSTAAWTGQLSEFMRTRTAILGTRPHTGFSALVLCLVASVIIPTSTLFSNRFWQFMALTPNDLALTTIWGGIASLKNLTEGPAKPSIIAMSQVGYLLDLQEVGHTFVAYRHYDRSGRSPIDDLTALDEFIFALKAKHATHALLLDPRLFFSPASTAALCSTHWPPSEATLAVAGTPELLALGQKNGLRQRSGADGIFLLTAPAENIRTKTPRR